MIARYAESRPELNHVSNDAQCVENPRPSVNEVAHEDGLASFWVSVREIIPAGLVTCDYYRRVSQQYE